jgi:L-alanine-DL-glutamate epimerase-like enolase superfamily enzyme
LLEEPIGIDSDGCVTVPEGPGLGIDFDLEKAKTNFPFA